MMGNITWSYTDQDGTNLKLSIKGCDKETQLDSFIVVKRQSGLSFSIERVVKNWPASMYIKIDIDGNNELDNFDFTFPQGIHHQVDNDAEIFSVDPSFSDKSFTINIVSQLSNPQGKGDFGDPTTTVTIGDAPPVGHD